MCTADAGQVQMNEFISSALQMPCLPKVSVIHCHYVTILVILCTTVVIASCPSDLSFHQPMPAHLTGLSSSCTGCIGESPLPHAKGFCNLLPQSCTMERERRGMVAAGYNAVYSILLSDILDIDPN